MGTIENLQHRSVIRPRMSAGRRLVGGPVIASLILAGAAGCSFVPDAVNPIEWYKGVRSVFGDGKTDEQRHAEAEAKRTPMPGADGSFPNLATVPARPTPPEEPASGIRDGLIEDRGNARSSDTELRERAAREASPPPPSMPVAGTMAPVVATPEKRVPPEVLPPRMPKLTRPPPPPSLDDPAGTPATGGTSP